MDKIIFWCVVGVVILSVIILGAVFVTKYIKTSPEERKKILKTYLKGIVALAEQEIVGTKRGQERLKAVENYFKEKAPIVYKILLLLLGKENFQGLVEEALKEIKESFEK